MDKSWLPSSWKRTATFSESSKPIEDYLRDHTDYQKVRRKIDDSLLSSENVTDD